MPEDFTEKDSMALGENELPKLRAYEPLELFFMLRLGRLLRLRQNASRPTETPEWLSRLLGKAVYSTYRDCVALGLEADAQTLFSKMVVRPSR